MELLYEFDPRMTKKRLDDTGLISPRASIC